MHFHFEHFNFVSVFGIAKCFGGFWQMWNENYALFLSFPLRCTKSMTFLYSLNIMPKWLKFTHNRTAVKCMNDAMTLNVLVGWGICYCVNSIHSKWRNLISRLINSNSVPIHGFRSRFSRKNCSHRIFLWFNWRLVIFESSELKRSIDADSCLLNFRWLRIHDMNVNIKSIAADNWRILKRNIHSFNFKCRESRHCTSEEFHGYGSRRSKLSKLN